MARMGLAFGAAGAGPRPGKSARVVGDVLGRFHPHGDQAAYDALVRMAQDFSQRYPLIDGQGNFGSRDGDGAAALAYTQPPPDPTRLPARLPFVLLNGASGIAVGLATEVPPHSLRGIAEATVALIKGP